VKYDCDLMMPMLITMIEEYGTPDTDPAAYQYLLTLALPMGEIKYILHHQRKPLDAKHCQNPGSLRVQAVFVNNRVLTIIQLRNGEFLTERNW
jgi:hypothetical protein